MSCSASPFNPRVVLGMLAVGAAAFLLFLYALGAGWTGNDSSTGSGHAASKALNGYAALYELLERRGYDVSLSRNRGRLDEKALLVLTPPHFMDDAALAELIEKRRLQGPTLLIVPKWFGFDASQVPGIKGAKRGWVLLSDAEKPGWIDKLGLGDLELEIGKSPRWRARGASGTMPKPNEVQWLNGTGVSGLVRGADGKVLAAYRDDGGYYENLEDFADATPHNRVAAKSAKVPAPVIQRGFRLPPETSLTPSVAATATTSDAAAAEDGDENYNPADDYWPLVIVADPDLFNNSGMADPARAKLAVDLVDATIDGYDLPVVFDLTLPGLGQHDSILKLAFEPPFLAATLALLLAALVVGWRGFVRFGPPHADMPDLAGGKAQLARDGAMLVARARRLALVGPPYAALVGRRIARALSLPERDGREARAAAIARALERRGQDRDAYARASEALRQARRPAELLRAAQALKSIERTLRR